MWSDQSDGGNVQKVENWSYAWSSGSYGNLVCTITAPDGGQEATYLGGANQTLTTKIVEPSGETVEYGYLNNRPYGAQYPVGSTPGGETNPYVAVEIHSVGPPGVPSQSAVTTHTVDKNGNQINDTFYDWVPYSSITHDSQGYPSWPSNATLLRSVTRSYNVTTATAGTGAENISDDPNAYWNPASQLLRSLLTSSATSGPGVGAFAQYSYDGSGNQLQEEHWDSTKAPSQPASLNSSNAVITTRTFDPYGNLLTVTDPNGNKDKYTYDSNNPYLTKFVRAAGTSHSRTFTYTWDSNTGWMQSRTDADNNITTTYSYDNLGRQTLAAISASGTNWSETQTTYNDQNRLVITQRDQNQFGDGVLIDVTTYDQLGRIALTQKLENGNIQSATDPTAGIKVQTRYQYSGANSYMLVSNPYRAPTSTAASSEPTMGWTLTTLDRDGRAIATQTLDGSGLPAPWGSNSNSSGTVQTAYNGTSQAVTDQAQKVTQTNMDGLGRISSVVQDPAGLNVTATYTYDAQDDLSTVTQGVQVRTFSYDSLKRLGSATNVESGTTKYRYDDNGNMTKKTDARGVVEKLTYDPLNRVTYKSYSDGTPSVSYGYDFGTYGKGRLFDIWAVDVSHFIYDTFDPLGNVTGGYEEFDQYVQSGSVYNFAYTYNLAGALTSETYPSGRKVSMTYDLANRASSVAGQVGSQPPTVYAANVTYAPHGAASSYFYPSGLNIQYGFNSRLQVCQIEHFFPPGDQPQTPLEEDVYWSASEPRCGVSADNNDTVRMIENWNGATPAHPTFVTFLQNFTYDNANRLTYAQESNVTGPTGPFPVDWSRNFNYDPYGNMWVTNPTGITPPGNTPSAQSNFQASNNQLATSLASYDAAGDQLAVNGYQVTYDGENRQTSVSSGSTSLGTYTYDGNGNRATRTTASGTTLYVYDALGQLAAEYSTAASTSALCQTCYLHRDHLGTVRLVTDASGNIMARHDYLPFGEEIPSGVPVGSTGRGDPTWDAADNINQKFTGKERDSESGLDYFGARFYGSALGRFTSPDEVLFDQEPSDPQSWNLYGYARNNPLSNVDPTGRACIYKGSGNVNDSGNYTDDNSGGQSCSEAFSSQQNSAVSATTNAQEGSLLAAVGTNAFLSFSNVANSFFSFISPNSQLLSDTPTGSGTAAQIGSGIGLAATLIGPGGEEATATREIKVSWARLLHVLARHTGEVAGKSAFDDAAEVTNLIKAAQSAPPIPQVGGNFERVVDAGRTVGTDVSTGQPTSVYTIITNSSGDLVTAFPGRPMR